MPVPERHDQPTDGPATRIRRLATSVRAALRDLGLLLHIPAAVAVIPGAMAAFTGEHACLWAFAALAIASLLVAQPLYWFGRGGHSASRPVPIITVALGWLAAALLCGIPFWLAARFAAGSDAADALRPYANPLNACFEGLSGLTSCGLTMAADPSAIPRPLQLFRTLLEAVGGVGIVVFLMLVVRPAESAGALYAAETRSEKFHGPVPATARRILLIYAGIMLAGFLAYLIAGVRAWEALNHALAAVSTGGFTVTENSFRGYGTAVKVITIALMLLGATSFALIAVVLHRRRFALLWRSEQVRALVGVVLLASATAFFSAAFLGEPVPIIDLVFQIVSAAATCGFTATGPGELQPAAFALLIPLMFVGGMAGSTSGGLKLRRVALLARGVWWHFANVSTGGKAMQEEGGQRAENAVHRSHAAGAVTVLFLFAALLGTLALLLTDSADRPDKALFETVSALSTVGLSAGITEPGMPWGGKVTLMALMWVGRLEIVAVLMLLFAPVFALCGHADALTSGDDEGAGDDSDEGSAPSEGDPENEQA